MFDPIGLANGLNNSKLTWYYNWKVQNDGVSLYRCSSEFVPMVWGKSDLSDWNLKFAKSQKSNLVLTFNEPDNADQSNMSVDEALNAWPKLQTLNKRLCSPVTANDPLKAGGWMEKFMIGVKEKNLRVDVICLHLYTDDFRNVTTALQALNAKIKAVYNKYNRPIILSEYSAVKWVYENGELTAIYPSDDFQTEFAARSSAMLMGLSYVEKFGWFSGPGGYLKGDNSALWDGNGKLTRVGKAYTSSVYA